MEITEVRVKLVAGKNDKLRAFCSITIDNDFVVRDLKVIDGLKGPFVAMPSRKIMDRCSRCSGKNHYRARYCNDCGHQLPRSRQQQPVGEELDGQERSKFHAEIAHPINSGCRERIQACVLEKYREELESPGAGRQGEGVESRESRSSTAPARPANPSREVASARDDDEPDDYFGGPARLADGGEEIALPSEPFSSSSTAARQGGAARPSWAEY